MTTTSFTLAASPFPNGTTVKVYPKSNWPTPDLPSGAPVGASAAEGAVSSGSVTFAGLTVGTAYWAVAEVGGVNRYVGFLVDLPETPANQAAEEVASANTITVSRSSTLIKITGTTEIKKINPTVAGHIIVVKFGSTSKLVKGENLKIPATVEPTADDCLTLVCDGTNWYQAAPLQAN